MASREYCIILTKQEWVAAMLKVNENVKIFGVVHYWPNHRYAYLEGSTLSELVEPPDTYDALVRSTPLDVERPPSSCFDQPTVDGFVHLDVPKVSLFSQTPRLVYTSVGIRAEDTRPDLPSPVPLFEAIKREFRRFAVGRLVRRRDGSPIKGLAYSAGALSMYDAGYELALDLRSPAEVIVGGKDDALCPAERWSVTEPGA